MSVRAWTLFFLSLREAGEVSSSSSEGAFRKNENTFSVAVYTVHTALSITRTSTLSLHSFGRFKFARVAQTLLPFSGGIGKASGKPVSATEKKREAVEPGTLFGGTTVSDRRNPSCRTSGFRAYKTAWNG